MHKHRTGIQECIYKQFTATAVAAAAAAGGCGGVFNMHLRFYHFDDTHE